MSLLLGSARVHCRFLDFLKVECLAEPWSSSVEWLPSLDSRDDSVKKDITRQGQPIRKKSRLIGRIALRGKGLKLLVFDSMRTEGLQIPRWLRIFLADSCKSTLLYCKNKNSWNLEMSIKGPFNISCSIRKSSFSKPSYNFGTVSGLTLPRCYWQSSLQSVSWRSTWSHPPPSWCAAGGLRLSLSSSDGVMTSGLWRPHRAGCSGNCGHSPPRSGHQPEWGEGKRQEWRRGLSKALRVEQAETATCTGWQVKGQRKVTVDGGVGGVY